MNEIHFTINMDNGYTLGFYGDMSIKYANVVARGDAITMVVCISRGNRSSTRTPLIIFTIDNSNYPIHGLDDSFLRVSYCIGPKGWIDYSLFSQYFKKLQSYQTDIHHRTKHIWADNCSA